jgi:hypothetical protein
MATRIAWLLNFDADLELRDPAAYRASRLKADRRAELSARMADLVAPDDVLLEQTQNGSLEADIMLQAFCPTPSALRRIAQLGFSPPAAPPLTVLRQVNDRSFCATLGHGLASSCFARDMATLERHLQQPSPTTRYVIKRAFAFAGREQRRVRNGVLDESTRGFCLRSLARGEGLQVEPWVERLGDFGKHGYLTQAGALLMGATREQRCDSMGRFLGMSMAPAQLSEAEDQLMVTELAKTAAALNAASYFGPFGIDGFRYLQPDGRIGFNPRCEINARLTMGYPRALLLEGLAREGLSR